MTILLYYNVECTVILNGTTQDTNRFLEDESNKTVMFHRLERIIEEFMSTFQSVLEVEKHNVGTQHKDPPEENENPAIMSNK